MDVDVKEENQPNRVNKENGPQKVLPSPEIQGPALSYPRPSTESRPGYGQRRLKRSEELVTGNVRLTPAGWFVTYLRYSYLGIQQPTTRI